VCVYGNYDFGFFGDIIGVKVTISWDWEREEVYIHTQKAGEFILKHCVKFREGKKKTQWKLKSENFKK